MLPNPHTTNRIVLTNFFQLQEATVSLTPQMVKEFLTHVQASHFMKISLRQRPTKSTSEKYTGSGKMNYSPAAPHFMLETIKETTLHMLEIHTMGFFHQLKKYRYQTVSFPV